MRSRPVQIHLSQCDVVRCVHVLQLQGSGSFKQVHPDLCGKAVDWMINHIIYHRIFCGIAPCMVGMPNTWVHMYTTKAATAYSHQCLLSCIAVVSCIAMTACVDMFSVCKKDGSASIANILLILAA